MHRGAWRATIHGGCRVRQQLNTHSPQGHRVGHDRATERQYLRTSLWEPLLWSFQVLYPKGWQSPEMQNMTPLSTPREFYRPRLPKKAMGTAYSRTWRPESGFNRCWHSRIMPASVRLLQPRSRLLRVLFLSRTDTISWQHSEVRAQFLSLQRNASQNVFKLLFCLLYFFGRTALPKYNNWCLRTVVLEKTLEGPLDSKIKPVNPKGSHPEYSLVMLKLKLQ